MGYDEGPNVPDWDHHRDLMSVVAGLVILFAILGTCGNLLTIAALVRSPRVRSASSSFIISLCVADFMFCAVNMPFSASRFLHKDWVHGDTLCFLFPLVRYFNVGLSLLSITAITVNRYILIVHQNLYDRIYKPKYIAAMIAFTWIFSFLMLVPTLAGVWGRFGFDPTILNCSILEVDGKSPKVFLFVIAFLVPCIAIVVCYARIFWVVRQSRIQVLSHSASPGSPLESTEQRKDRESKRRREEWRVTRMVLIIFCSFVVCYLPITIVKVTDPTVRYPKVHLLSYILIYMSACINPIIYGVTNKQYRQAYKSVLQCCWPPQTRASTARGQTVANMETSVNRTMVSVIALQPIEEKNSSEDG